MWGRSSTRLERFPVTEEVAGSSPVGPAKFLTHFDALTLPIPSSTIFFVSFHSAPNVLLTI